MASRQRERGLSPDQAAAELVEAAESICVHLYGKGHTKYYTRRLIASALVAADNGQLGEFVATLNAPPQPNIDDGSEDTRG